jgi:hypothetical protein
LLGSAGTVLPVALTPSQYRRSAQRIHTAALAAGLVLLLSGLVSVQVGLILLSIASVAALPVLVSRHSELLRSTVLWLWVSWWLLWMLSLTWSATPGAAHWDAMWGLVVIPAVMPVAHKPARWLFPVAIGVGLHSLTQATAWSGLIDTTWFTEVRKPFRGLHWYSPYVAVWAMTSMLLMIGAAACKSRRGVRIAALVLAIAAVVGLLLTMNRTSWVALGLNQALDEECCGGTQDGNYCSTVLFLATAPDRLNCRWPKRKLSCHRSGARLYRDSLPITRTAHSFPQQSSKAALVCYCCLD